MMRLMNDPKPPSTEPSSATREVWFRDDAVVIRTEPRLDPEAVRRALPAVREALEAIKAQEKLKP